jgi:hypothetical protein
LETNLGKTSLSRIARVLAVVWPLIWTANVFADDCKTFFGGMHKAVAHDTVSGHGVVSGYDHGKGQHGAHEHGNDASDEKDGADSCCCDTLTDGSAVVAHNASPPSERRGHAQPDPASQVGVSDHFPALQLARADSRPPPRNRTPLFLLHLRLLN